MKETSDLRERWIKRLKQEERAHKAFRDEAKAAQEAYLADKDQLYPLFWSTVKVLHARIYAQPPKPDVRKRYQDDPGTKPATGGQYQDPVAALPGMGASGPQPGSPIAALSTLAPNGMPPGSGSAQLGAGQPAPPPVVDDNRIAQCIERALTYTIDTTDFDADGHMAVNDLLVAGLGVAKVELDTQTEIQPIINPVTGQPILGEDGKPQTKEVITSQKVKLKSFAWQQFRFEPQQHWSQVSWVAFDHWMTTDEIEAEFGVTLDNVTNETGESVQQPDKPDASKYKTLYRVSEIWSKPDRSIIFVADIYPDVLDKRKDALGLEDFYPCPKPMFVNVKGDDLVPKPDYSFCAPLFDYVNELTSRILKLTKQIKDIGFYDAAFQELSGLISAKDGDLMPIANLAARIAAIGSVGKSGYDAVVAKQDNTGKVQVVQELMTLREAAKANIWETYGVADIQRGSTNPNETATAQQIKAQWADIRVGERIRIVSLFFRDVFRIQAEIIAEHFQPDQLYAMTGIQLNDQEMQVLRSDLGRCYAIDVESDSTVVQDESAQKAQRLEFLTTVTGYLQQVLPAIKAGVMPGDLGKELLIFAVNTFKNGRQLEDAINAAPGTMEQLQQLQQQVQQSQQQSQQLQEQLTAAQQQLQQINAGKEQRDNIKVASDAQKKDAETVRTQVETAQMAQDIRKQAMEPLTLVPHAPPIAPGLRSNVATPDHFVG